MRFAMMRSINVIMISIFMPMMMVAMDLPTKSSMQNEKSIVERRSRFAKGMPKNASLVVPDDKQTKTLPQSNAIKPKKNDGITKQIQLFQEYLKSESDDKVVSLLKESLDLRTKHSLAEKIWSVYHNKSTGFYLCSAEDYMENAVPLASIVKVSLLVACAAKNKTFLDKYHDEHKDLLKIIGNARYEEIYGSIALKAILGSQAYREYADLELNTRVLAHIASFSDPSGDDETSGW